MVKKMWIKTRSSQSLQNNFLDINALKPILLDNNDIKDIKLRLTKCELIKGVRGESKEVMKVYFTKIENSSWLHKLSATLEVYFSSRGTSYKAKISGEITGKYTYDGYLFTMQNYLYTFLARMLEANETIRDLKFLHLPESMSALIPVRITWSDPYRNREYGWMPNEQEDGGVDHGFGINEE
jgi:hypothetical protein